MRVQRTRSSPSAPHSPLTRRPLGAGGRSWLWVVAPLVTVAAVSCASSGIERYCCPTPENQIRVSVRELLVHPAQEGQSVGVAASVLFRDVDGRVLFTARTDEAGRLVVPVDYRAVSTGQQLEARIDIGSQSFFGGVIGVTPGVQGYEIVVPPLAAVVRVEM
jgi:hypothetical protein